MNQKKLLLALVAMFLFSIFFYFIQGITSATELKCQSYFSKCTDGGCDASPGWKAEHCIIRCGPPGSEEVQCQVPQI